jgi:hypothetical protein
MQPPSTTNNILCCRLAAKFDFYHDPAASVALLFYNNFVDLAYFTPRDCGRVPLPPLSGSAI